MFCKFMETDEDLSVKYQNKVDAERSFKNEVAERENEIKRKQKELNRFNKGK